MFQRRVIFNGIAENRKKLRTINLQNLLDSGIDFITSDDFSFYD